MYLNKYKPRKYQRGDIVFISPNLGQVDWSVGKYINTPMIVVEPPPIPGSQMYRVSAIGDENMKVLHIMELFLLTIPEQV